MDRRDRRALVASLNRDARCIALHFGLRYRSIEAERSGVNGHYGICYSDGSIRIRLAHASTGRPLKYSSLINTLCHELAHLRHFDHGPRFKAFYLRILEWARREGIYRPRAAAARGTRPQPTRTPAPSGWPAGSSRGVPPRPARPPADIRPPRVRPAEQLELFEM